MKTGSEAAQKQETFPKETVPATSIEIRETILTAETQQPTVIEVHTTAIEIPTAVIEVPMAAIEVPK